MVASQVQKELFKKWLKENRNISESTFISYTEGVLDKIHEVIRLSNDAKLKNLNPDLYSYDTLDKYDKFFNILKNDPNFDIVNKTGQAQSGWLSTPLNHYRRYLEAQPQGNNSTEKLIEYIKQYKVFKSSNEYDEEYKWDYAKKHQGDFNTLDNFENKINSLENYNIRPYFLQRTGLNNLMQPYNIETFKNSLKILFDENKNLEIRIKEFLNNLHHLLKNDVHWNNKNMLPDEVDASYFLFTNNYEKYLLFNQKTSFNCFAKHFGLFDLLDKSDKVKRYIRFQEYCQNQLIPIMNDTLGCQNTLLDAQDFIRFVDKYILKNINNLEYNKDAVKTVQYKETHMNENTNPLNQILYGPPGTGKTYNTVIKAIEITNPELIQKDKDGNVKNYEVLKEKFDKLKQQGQIEFVTFHQSYSYEEFVEGIKPDISKWNDDGSELKYVGKDGIFKNICEHAKPIKVSSIKHQPIDFSNTKVFKMSLGNTLEKEDDIYEYCISNDVVALGFKDVDFSDCKTSQDFKDKDDSWGATALERFINWMDVGDIIIISNGNKNFRAIAQVTGNYYYDRTTPIRYSHFRKVEWLYKGEDIYYSKINNKVFSQQSIYGYFDPSKKGMPNYNPDLNTQELNNIITGKVDKEIALPHILIIDEINRGNISKIFGELITLIEEDKRGTLSVKLPYSQEDFTVPQNLYIIGTMNTSDRSIASIDIALRRRFKFVEMMPRPELVADFGCSFQSIFEKLNTTIKILLDRDHQIGHSYFINTKYANADTNILKEIWFSEIIPLLNEYFYCDWEKLKLVIPGFIKEINIPEELKNECEDSMYEFKTPNEIKDFVGALKQDKFKQEN
ncbi:TPA: AAA family ATPase [Candidatus Avigastranaerophilus faecigallinarum]|nr:AAA family ATPase [Candidatus Avigastranaerophilus faecigallinarum]